MANKPAYKIHGIKNCDTMKKAFAWLVDHGIAFDFIDYRKDGISIDQLADWSRRTDWQLLLNKRGTTWGKLADDERADVDETKALALMAAHPSLIKRPVIDTDDSLLIGFDPERYTNRFLGTNQ